MFTIVIILAICQSATGGVIRRYFNNQNLKDFPTDIAPDVNDIYAQYNLFTEVPPGVLANITNLNSISLNNNKMVAFPNLCDVGHSLTHLLLHVNFINETSYEKFACLTKLKELNLQNNKLTHFPNISCLGDTLIKLNLIQNPMTYFLDGVLDPMVTLITFYMSHVYFNDSDFERLGVPPKLSDLRITHNKLTTNPDLGRCNTTLTRLDLENNLISVLDLDRITVLGRLTTLIISNNIITEVSRQMSRTSNIRTLYYDNAFSLNNATFDVLSAMPQLDYLEMKPASANLENWNIPVLTNLANIYMRTGQITSVPDLTGFSRLYSLDIIDNPVTQFPDLAKGIGQTIQRLKFSGNGDIPNHALSGYFPVLSELVMNRNYGIKRFPKLGNMTMLNTINFMTNSIEVIPCDAIPYLPNLGSIYLHKNLLTALPDFSMNTPIFTLIDITNNPLNCDCNIGWLKEKGIALYRNDLFCSQPSELVGVGYNTLTMANFTCPGDAYSPTPAAYQMRDTTQFYKYPKTSYLKTTQVRSHLECSVQCHLDMRCNWFDIKEMNNATQPGTIACEMYTGLCTYLENPVPFSTAYIQIEG